MPIIDVEFVGTAAGGDHGSLATELAATLGRVLATPPGRTWVRVRTLDAACYAENESPVLPSALPVFITILHAHPPAGPALAAEAAELTRAIASCLAVSPGQVHVQYAPAAAGRQAFGGSLVE